MTKEEYQEFVLRYKGCGACFPNYYTLSQEEKMWFSAIQKDVVDIEKENVELKEKNNQLARKCDCLTKCNDGLQDLLSNDIDILEQLVKAREFLNKAILTIEELEGGYDESKWVRGENFCEEVKQFLKG